MHSALSIALMLSACCIASTGFAYDSENGVPLTVGVQLGETRIKAVQISLSGREVELAVSLSNWTKRPQYAGFYATTPLFGYLGEGEEYADKTFHDLKAFQDGDALRVTNTQRAYFLGQDITPILRKAGIGPIYSNEIHWKKLEKLPTLENIRIDNWQSQVSFGWSARIAPKSTTVETVTYSSLPQFGIESLDSEGFSQLVQQHCGQPEALKELVHAAAPEETGVLAEVFQFPLPFLNLEEARVTIEKPKSRWMHSRPIAAVACGYEGALELPSEGVIRRTNNTISILVVSLLPSAPADETSAMPTLHYKVRHRHSQCNLPYKSLGAPRGRSPYEALQVANIKLAASKDKILALVTSFLSDGQTSRYHVLSIDPRTCKASLAAKLGDPDLLVELGQSRHGGWWITGSIEQTLLTSRDGKKWSKARLPEGLSSLVSSYVVDSKQIWLAGILDNSDDHPNLLVYSGDGGITWSNLKRDDALLSKVPAGWLEGQKRKAAR